MRIGLRQVEVDGRSARDGQRNNIQLRSTHDNDVRSPSNPADVSHKLCVRGRKTCNDEIQWADREWGQK